MNSSSGNLAPDHAARGDSNEPAGGPSVDSTEPANRWKRRVKFLVFSLLPVVSLVVLVEALLRLSGWDQPSIVNFQPELDYPDEDLFWSLPPSARIRSFDTMVITNSLGLRDQELDDKQPDEFRILSLGESTTFGAKVENDETYSAQLELALKNRGGARRFRVINAGVSGYTSFQSLKYLQLRGLDLKPDMVLLYHEFNDFLPAWHARVTNEAVTDLALTDMQLFRSREQKLHRKLLSYSAIYRVLHSLSTRRQIEEFESDSKNLPDHLRPVDYILGGRDGSDRKLDLPAYFQQGDLPIRVPPDERREVLNGFASLCRNSDIQLVVIHPSYYGVPRHECELTSFCLDTGIPLFDAFDALQPLGPHVVRVDESGVAWSEPPYFADELHPNAEGHKRLAEQLCAFLIDEGLIPSETGPLEQGQDAHIPSE